MRAGTGGDAEMLFRAWKTNHTFSPVRRPTGNAVAARVILTLKTEWVWARDRDAAAELRTAIIA